MPITRSMTVSSASRSIALEFLQKETFEHRFNAMKKIALMLVFGFAASACGDDAQSAWCDRDDGSSEDVRSGGEVLATVCYGPRSGSLAIRVEDENDDGLDLDFPQTRNNEVVVFGDDTNGDPITGDVYIDGNKITIYGNGAENTIIDGDLTVDGNNVRIRGITVTGSLVVLKNNVSVVDSVIRGNLAIGKNNTLIAGSAIYGSVTSTSNNNLFVNNDVQGSWSIGGKNATCEDNASFSDQDDDFVIDDDEVGAALLCGDGRGGDASDAG